MPQFGSQCVYSCFCDIALHEIKHMFPSPRRGRLSKMTIRRPSDGAPRRSEFLLHVRPSDAERLRYYQRCKLNLKYTDFTNFLIPSRSSVKKKSKFLRTQFLVIFLLLNRPHCNRMENHIGHNSLINIQQSGLTLERCL